MNRLLLISPDQGSGFKPILSGKSVRFYQVVRKRTTFSRGQKHTR